MPFSKRDIAVSAKNKIELLVWFCECFDSIYCIRRAWVIELNFINTINTKTAYIYIYLSYLMSLTVTHFVLKNSCFSNKTRNILYFTAAFTILFVALNLIGQRELNAMCFFTPYLFLNLSSKKPSTQLSILVAILAVIGLLQAPFYLILPIILDIYSNIKKQHYLRKSQVTFYSLFIVTLVINYALYPTYFQKILELAYLAQPALNLQYSEIFFQLCIISTIFLTFFMKNNTKKTKFLLLITGSLAIYLIERKMWFYHLFPTIYLTMLALALMLTQKEKKNYITPATLVNLFILIFFILLIQVVPNYRNKYDFFSNPKSTTNKLINFSNLIKQKKETLFFLTTRVTPTYTIRLQTGVTMLSPWANDWILPEIITCEIKYRKNIACKKLKTFYHDLMLKILREKPTYIIYRNGTFIPYIPVKNFDYYYYLNQNKQLSPFLKKYKKVRSIGNFIILKR